MVDLVKGVTPDNFAELAKAFMGSAKKSFAISVRDRIVEGIEIPATPRQWGAWRAWRVARGLPVAFMDMQAKANKAWTVPAEWPHEFDAGATVQGDNEAGDRFLRNRRDERPDMRDQAARLIQAATWREKRWRGFPKRASSRPAFTPFPRLAEAFAGEPHLVEDLTFAEAEQASRLLTVEGQHAARRYLKPDPPPAALADQPLTDPTKLKTPPAPPSERLKELIRRQTSET